jgi:hypothetical protein
LAQLNSARDGLWNSRRVPPVLPPPRNGGEETMSRGKMKGDDSAQSKRGEARGSGGTTKKSQNAGKQHNNKADNTKSNRQ